MASSQRKKKTPCKILIEKIKFYFVFKILGWSCLVKVEKKHSRQRREHMTFVWMMQEAKPETMGRCYQGTGSQGTSLLALRQSLMVSHLVGRLQGKLKH